MLVCILGIAVVMMKVRAPILQSWFVCCVIAGAFFMCIYMYVCVFKCIYTCEVYAHEICLCVQHIYAWSREAGVLVLIL